MTMMTDITFDERALRDAMHALHQQGLSLEQTRDVFKSIVWLYDALIRCEREGP
jgi:hypothetical protein